MMDTCILKLYTTLKKRTKMFKIQDKMFNGSNTKSDTEKKMKNTKKQDIVASFNSALEGLLCALKREKPKYTYL